MEGCDVAYYLIHAMEDATDDYVRRDREAATNFQDAAEGSSLQRIIYLGGLGDDEGPLSTHLESRHEVGRILAEGSTAVTELRAAVIIGSGSVSFELIRHLTDVLPVMFRPGWLRTRCQPIGIRNVLEILVSILDEAGDENRLYDIGGPDVLTYEQMMLTYADVVGLGKRWVVPFPLFNARMAPRVIGLVTPLDQATIRPLIESLRTDVVVERASPLGFEPGALFDYRTSVKLALSRISEENVETRWSDAMTQPALPLPGDPSWSGAAMMVDQRESQSSAPAEDLFWAVTRIGGDVGYYSMNWTWRIRGWLDSLIGGVGLRRGRRHPEDLRSGEALDFFRVVEVDPAQHLLTLQAEMKVPGSAWLGWKVDPAGDGSRLIQSAMFVPRGLLGRLYWWVLLPFHAPIWRRMVRHMAETAEQRGSR
jgi:uncharacterized protein YbjT (DUF2867 family)